MKLLFDNNLSVRIPQIIEDDFPESTHVGLVELLHATDSEIWHFAKNNGFSIVTKDKDFYHLCTTFGSPPKVIWLITGNCKNKEVINLIRDYNSSIRSFLRSNKDILIIP